MGFDKSKSEDKLLLYFHGGFFMLSDCRDHLNILGPVIKVAGIKALCVDYPLAPEHPFPAALNSALAVYKWALGQGYKPAQIGLLGDSVGEGFTQITTWLIAFVQPATLCCSPGCLVS